MSDLSCNLNTLSRKYKQTGGGGIPFSALQQGGKKNIRRRSKKTRRSPSRKRRVSRRISRRTKRKSNRKKTIKNKKKCTCGSHTYTGGENTPRGFGNCEECIPLNVVLKGKDGKLYENKNNHWTLFN